MLQGYCWNCCCCRSQKFAEAEVCQIFLAVALLLSSSGRTRRPPARHAAQLSDSTESPVHIAWWDEAAGRWVSSKSTPAGSGRTPSHGSRGAAGVDFQHGDAHISDPSGPGWLVSYGPTQQTSHGSASGQFEQSTMSEHDIIEFHEEASRLAMSDAITMERAAATSNAQVVPSGAAMAARGATELACISQALNWCLQ